MHDTDGSVRQRDANTLILSTLLSDSRVRHNGTYVTGFKYCLIPAYLNSCLAFIDDSHQVLEICPFITVLSKRHSIANTWHVEISIVQ